MKKRSQNGPDRLEEGLTAFSATNGQGISLALVFPYEGNDTPMLGSGRTRGIWIGNIGAAIAVATGALTGFSTVVNASGCERTSISLGRLFSMHGRTALYKTTWDSVRGITLEDSRFMSVESVANRRIATGEVSKRGVSKPGVAVMDERGVVKKTYAGNQRTRAAFHSLICHGRDMVVEELRKRDGSAVLIHCRGGINRSAALVVATLLSLWGNNDVDRAIELLVDAATRRGLRPHTGGRKTRKEIRPVLNNQDFESALRDLPASTKEADIILDDEISSVEELCMTLAKDNVQARVSPSSVASFTKHFFVGEPTRLEPSDDLTTEDDGDVAVSAPHSDCNHSADYAIDVVWTSYQPTTDEKQHVCCVCGTETQDPLVCVLCGDLSDVFCSVACRTAYTNKRDGLCVCQQYNQE